MRRQETNGNIYIQLPFKTYSVEDDALRAIESNIINAVGPHFKAPQKISFVDIPGQNVARVYVMDGPRYPNKMRFVIKQVRDAISAAVNGLPAEDIDVRINCGGLLEGIAGHIAVGGMAAYAVVLTFRWLKNKIREKLNAKNAKKVAVADLGKLIESCENIIAFDELENLVDDGYTHLLAIVDKNGEVIDVEIIQDKSDTIDEEVDQFINRTGEGMVVVTK